MFYLEFFEKEKHLGFWPGDSTLKENWSDMSKDAAKSVQSRKSEIDEVRECTPRASFWSSLRINQKKKKKIRLRYEEDNEE